MHNVGAIILAAGGSSRFGRAKQLAHVNGVPLLRRVVAMATIAGCRPVVVVTGRDSDACETLLADIAVRVVSNERWESGMGSSLRLGVLTLLESAETERAFILLGDQPAITPDQLRHMADAQRSAGTPVAVAEFAGTVGPPVLVARDILQSLREWPDEYGAKSLWENRPELVTRVQCPQAEIDIDTPADLDRFQRSERSQ